LNFEQISKLSISIKNTLYNEAMNLHFLPNIYQTTDLDGAQKLKGKGWEVINNHDSKRENDVDIEYETTI
jgi:hypothetical protein